jgi:hypothetical protein
MRRSAQILLARFALIYGLLVWLCASVPLYAWIEDARRASPPAPARARDAGAHARARAAGDSFVYVYDVRIGRGLAHRSRAVPQSTRSCSCSTWRWCCATPGLGRRKLGFALLGGGTVVFLLCVGMLMSDVVRWEADALAGAGLDGAPGPWPVPVGFMAGLHRTAAAGLRPVVLWVFFAIPKDALRARTRSATSRA